MHSDERALTLARFSQHGLFYISLSLFMYEYSEYRPRLFPAFSGRQWLALSIGVVVVAILSLGVHDLAIAHLGVPYPDKSAVPAWARLIGQFVQIAAIVYFCRLASWYLDLHSALAASLLVGALVVGLHETLRVVVVDNVLVEGWVDNRWVYMVLQRLPGACLDFFWGVSAVVIARRFAAEPLPVVAVAVFVATAVGYFIVRPAVAGGAQDIIQALQLSEPPELYQMPYTFYIYKFIYGMFIEPAIAMLLIVSMAWPGLQGMASRRIAALAVLTLLMRGRIVAITLHIFWIPLPLGTSIAAEGQFFCETFVLAVLMSIVWCLLIRNLTGLSRQGSTR
jgi:hypothetical protein